MDRARQIDPGPLSFFTSPSLDPKSDESCDRWTPEGSCVFAHAPANPQWHSSLASYCRQKQAAGGLFWLSPGNSFGGGQSLLYDAAGKVVAPALLRVAKFEIAIPATALLTAGAGQRLIVRGTSPADIKIRYGSGDPESVDQIDISLGPSSIAGTLHFNHQAGIQPQFKYFYGNPVKEIAYPLWSGAAAKAERVRVQVDPRRPFDPSITKITPISPGPFATNLRTNKGNIVTLKPVPPDAGYALQYDPVSGADPAYDVIVGPWEIGLAGLTGTAEPLDLMCGLSGVEYIECPPGTRFNFVPGPAFAPGFGPSGIAGKPLLVDQVTGGEYPVRTPWVYPISAGSVYFAQPARAPFYTPAAIGATGAFLSGFEIASSSFPQPTQATFPLTAYAEATGDPKVVTDFEASVLSPQRRNVISSLAGAPSPGPVGIPHGALDPGGTCLPPSGVGPTGPFGPPGPFVYAATSQGLLATFDSGSLSWETLTLASTDEGTQQLQLAGIKGPLRSSLLTNNLFLVVSSPEKLQDACSVNYKLTSESFTGLLNIAKVPANVVAHARYLKDILYESREYFQAVLEAALGECYKTYGQDFIHYAEFFELIIQDWTFQMAPRLWKDHGTIMILKFSDLPLETLAADPNLWVEAERFNDDVKATQKALAGIIADAKQQASGHSVFNYFVHTVLANQQANGGGTQVWTGILFLSCVTPIDLLPPQLEGLAAGLDRSKFFAHHVGVNLSPLDYPGGQVIRVRDSSLFGLIFYQDPGDLRFDENAYQFKVLLLSVLFANSQIASFDSQIELLVGKLFGELSTLQNTQHGNNLILRGTYQDHDGEKSYVFLEESLNRFTMTSQVLYMVEIDKVQFVTLLQGQQTGQVRSRFSFWGTVRFLKLAGFDLFSFGPGFDSAGKQTTDGRVAFSNLGVNMTFDPSKPGEKPGFAFDATQVNLDLSQTVARPASLYKRFPLTLTGIVQGQEKESPASLGFIPVKSPLESQQVSSPWFGLQFSLNLGSPGALAAKAGFAATLLAAWSPSQPKYMVFTGVQLPGSSGGKRQISIEGPLVLKIGAIEFQVTPEENYILRFRNIALGLLGLQFPPGGQTEVLLFGDPREGASNTLGWYAAYKKDEPKKSSQDNLLPGR